MANPRPGVVKKPPRPSPYAKKNPVLPVGGSAGLDIGVVDRDPSLACLEPGRHPLLHLSADMGVGAVGAEIAPLLRIVGEIEQHRTEILPPDVFPALGAHH